MTFWMRFVIVTCLTLAFAISIAPSTSSPFCKGALMAQAAPEMPPPGNPGHNPPPKGAYCDRSSVSAHHCECHNKCVVGDDGQLAKQEDWVNCRAYCFKDRCRCPWEGCNNPAPQHHE